jgi:hypothetical protein
MKHPLISILTLFILVGFACSRGQQDTHSTVDHNSPASETNARKPLSPRTTAMASIGDTHIHIDYSSPSVRGRTIWGGLVAYDEVWVTGAHKATSIEFDDYLRIEGKVIPPGKYAFFTIPGKDKWTLILNENQEQHLADEYDEARDIIRISVVPERLEQPIESLTYEIEPAGDKKGKISVSWEHIKVSFSVEDV